MRTNPGKPFAVEKLLVHVIHDRLVNLPTVLARETLLENNLGCEAQRLIFKLIRKLFSGWKLDLLGNRHRLDLVWLACGYESRRTETD